jgi:hypothetical protein
LVQSNRSLCLDGTTVVVVVVGGGGGSWSNDKSDRDSGIFTL